MSFVVNDKIAEQLPEPDLSETEFVETLKQRLTTAIAYNINILNDFYKCRLPDLDIDFSLRGKTAGQLCARSNGFTTSYTIRLNLAFARKHHQEFVDDVIPHELAHFYILWKYGIQRKSRKNRIRPHGLEWQSVMLHCFKRPAEIYHSFDVPEQNTQRKMQTYTYKCSCRTHKLSAIRHNKIQKGKMKYLCQFCKKSLNHIAVD